MATNQKNYMRIYQKNRRAGKEVESMTEEIYKIGFSSKITTAQLKKAYKDKITTDEEKVLLINALSLVELIQVSKQCLDNEGVYTRTATGLVKENPAQKSLRENIKSLISVLDALNKLIESNKIEDEVDLEKWLDS